MTWKTATQRVDAFLAQFPLNPRAPLTRFEQKQIDAFALTNGYYPNLPAKPSKNDMNLARSGLIGQLRQTGRAPRWIKERGTAAGFFIAIVGKKPTVWEVQPLDIAGYTMAARIDKRNLKTVNNRFVTLDKTLAGVDRQANSKAEFKALQNDRAYNQQKAIQHSQLTQLAIAAQEKIHKQLERKEPHSGLVTHEKTIP